MNPRPDDAFGDEQDPPMGLGDLLLFATAVVGSWVVLIGLAFAARPLLRLF